MIRPARRLLAMLLMRCSLLAGLAGLAEDLLAEVAHTLALVGLGLAHGADVGGDLADQFLVDAADDHPCLRRALEGDAVRCRHQHGVAEPEREAQAARSDGLGAVADADDRE